MSEPGVSAGEAGGLLAGAILLLGVFGKGVRWLFDWSARRKDSYHAKLKVWDANLRERETTLDAGLKGEISELKDEVAALRTGSATMAVVVERYRVSVILLVHDAIAHRPESPALVHVRDVLAEAFPVHLSMPPEMAALIDRLDQKGGI